MPECRTGEPYVLHSDSGVQLFDDLVVEDGLQVAAHADQGLAIHDTMVEVELYRHPAIGFDRAEFEALTDRRHGLGCAVVSGDDRIHRKGAKVL